MGQVYTHGTWHAKPCREDEFVAAWRELADWTLTVFPDARGTLLRDRDDPTRFASFGPWDGVETVARWRAHPEFQRRVERMQELLETFKPQLMEEVAAAGR